MVQIPISRTCSNGIMLMSRKSSKKQDDRKTATSAKRLKNSWGKGRQSSPHIRIRPIRLLIVTEGSKTEPLYFTAFRDRINQSYGREYITVEIYGLGDNTVSLFNRAKKLADRDAEGFTHVWVVYDKDSFPAGDFNVVPEICKSASTRDTEYRAAWTNEAFELWYLLHFGYIDSALSRDAYEPKLTAKLKDEGLGRYQKNRNDMFDILEDRIDNAISNAERLEKKNAGLSPANCNPGTTIHQLVKDLLPYIRSENDVIDHE